MISICSLFKVGIPDEKGEHCEVKKEEKIEPSKYIDVLIQIQHSVNVHYTTHNIPSQDAGCGLGIGYAQDINERILQEKKIKLIDFEGFFVMNLTCIVFGFHRAYKSEL